MVRPEWFEKVEDIEVPHTSFSSKIISLLLGISVLMLSALAVFGIVRTIQANNAPAVAETTTQDQEIQNSSSGQSSTSQQELIVEKYPSGNSQSAVSQPTSPVTNTQSAPPTANNSQPLPKVSPTSTSRHSDEGEHRERHGEKNESAHEEDDDD